MYDRCSDVQSTTVVSGFATSERVRALQATRAPKHNMLHRTEPRTHEKQDLGTGSLESIWQACLSGLGWSERAIQQYMLSLALSTRVGYNSALDKCRQFCEQREINFPPQHTSDLAEFLCKLSDSSARPRSMLCTTIAALASVYSHRGDSDLTKDMCIVRLITSLIKSSTVIPMKRSSVLPVDVITNMFISWGPNKGLSLHNLRLKALALLALVFSFQ